MSLNFPPLDWTPEGIALIVKGLAGAEIRFSELVWLLDGVEVARMQASEPAILEENRVRLNYTLLPQGGDYVRFNEARLYAIDPDIGDIVFSQSESPIPLDVLNLNPREVPVRTGVGNATNVTVIIAEIPFIPIEMLGEPNGVPLLDEHGKLKIEFMPDTGSGSFVIAENAPEGDENIMWINIANGVAHYWYNNKWNPVSGVAK